MLKDTIILIFVSIELFWTCIFGVEIAKRLSENSLKETISYYFRDFKKLNFLGKGLFLILVLFSIPAILLGLFLSIFIFTINFVYENRTRIFYKKED